MRRAIRYSRDIYVGAVQRTHVGNLT